MPRKGKHPLLEGVRIEDIAAEGKAIARIDDKVLFVPFAVPGDLVDVQVIRKRKNFVEGRVVAYHEYSPSRVEPFCEHFGLCGGCKWQNLPYEEQLRFKQRQVFDQLTRIGKVELPPIQPILPSEHIRFYRNKLEYTFSESRWLTPEEIQSADTIEREPALGYHIPGRFDKVFDVEHCYLQPEPSNAIRLEVKRIALELGLPFINLRTKEGVLRNIVIRTASTGDVMVILSVTEAGSKVRELMDRLLEAFPQITSLYYVINTKLNDSLADLDHVCYAGNRFIMEQMEGVKFKIGPKSFYQTNSQQACRLYRVTREFADFTGSELVYDLYTGTGTIANFIASGVREVIGVEYVPEAIEDARENSRINGIGNTRFFAGDMKDLLTERFLKQNGYPDVVILDPPRAGVHADVLDVLMRASPDRIVYVSCNPATQARDVALLSDCYRVEKVQPVDMFPHTHHVENVLLLRKRG